MITGSEILICLTALITGVIAGTMISVVWYPRWEVMKLIRKQKSLGYGFGKWNHFSRLVDHNFREIVKPNCETLYSTVFIRKKDGPLVLEFPDFKDYFNFAFLNKDTDVVDYITNREAGSKEMSHFLIAFGSEIPQDNELPLILLSSDICWIIGRFEIKSPEDLVKVSRKQKAVRLTKYDDFIGIKGKED